MDLQENETDNTQEDRFNLSRKIFVGNISFRVTQGKLTKFFTKFGPVDYCYLVKDHILKRPRGIAFITFQDKNDVVKALQASEEQLTLDGRIMRVSRSEESTRVKHVEGTVYDLPADQDLNQMIENLQLDTDQNENNCCYRSSFLETCKCPTEKLTDEILSLIMHLLPLKQRISVERVCKRWNTIAKQSWEKQKSLNFKNAFTGKRFDGLTDTKLYTVLVRCGMYLRELDVSSSPRLLSDMSMDIIAAQCPNLETLDLSGVSVTDISLRTLGRHCTKLKSLCLQKCFHVTDKGLYWLFENCPNIEDLDLQGNSSVTGNCFQKIGEGCKRLNLTDCIKLTDTGMKKICRHCKNLQELAISNCQLLTRTSFINISENLLSLRTLYLEKTLSNIGAEELLLLKSLSKLEHVYLSQNLSVNDEFLTVIANNCPFLQTLDISSCHRSVTSAGIKSLGICSSLTSLDISYLNEADDESIQVLARNGKLKSLTARACNSLTDEAFEDLACLCHDLELLDVSGCCSVSYKTFRNFQESVPLDRAKKLNLHIGGTSIESEQVENPCLDDDDGKLNPNIAYCFQDFSQNCLRVERGNIILPDFDTDEEVERHYDAGASNSDPELDGKSMVVAAGAENDETGELWETEETEFYCHDGFLDADDPLEMERFELS